MPELELDIESHRYTLDGMVIPGCTQVLAAMGATPGFNFLSDDELEFYRSRGHAVHSAVEYAIKGTLDRRSLDRDEVKPYLRGWDQAVTDHGIEVLELNGNPFVEIPLSHPMRYGVKPDVVARVRSVNNSGAIEIKATSAHAPATGLQLAAQLMAVRNVMPKIGNMRIGLRLLPKPPYYDLKHYTDADDEIMWRSMVNSYNWLKKHRLLKENRR
jgi:hypothetical protein